MLVRCRVNRPHSRYARGRVCARSCARHLSLNGALRWRAAAVLPVATHAAPSPRFLGSESAGSLLHRLRAGILGEAERVEVSQGRAIANEATHLGLYSYTAGRRTQHHAVWRKGRYPAQARGTRQKAKPAAAEP